VTVDSLFSKNSDLWTIVERGEAFEERIGDIDRWVEGEVVEETGVVLTSDVFEFLEGTSGTVSE